MLVVHRARNIVREMIVLGRCARFPVVPRALRIDRVHPAELFYTFAMRVLGFCHAIRVAPVGRAGQSALTGFLELCVGLGHAGFLGRCGNRQHVVFEGDD